MNAQSTPANGVVTLDEGEILVGLSLTQLALRRLRRDYLTIGALVVLIILGILSYSSPLITKHILGIDYRSTCTTTADRFLKVGASGHLLGTDDLCRDHLARLLYGGRVSLSVALASAMLSLVVGSSLGLIAGYNQGGQFKFIDDGMMWFISTLNSVPSLYLLILIAALLNPTVISLILILSVFSWTFTMRLVRGQTLSIRESEYVLAAKAMGAGPIRIMFVHILPNVFSVLVIDLATNIGYLILAESALSFLQLGVREPTPSWGNMLTNSQSFFHYAPHLVIFPGMLIVITVLCTYLIGDGLRDAFDPQASKKI